VRIGPLMAVGAAVLVSCAPAQWAPAASFPVPPGFVFVRDNADRFPLGERRQAEESLGFMAARTGVYGVVVTAEEVEDPSQVAGPILSEIEALGGEGLIGICTPTACDLTAATAYSDSLADVLARVAPVPDAAPGQGIPVARRDDLRRWRELVGAVSTIER